MTLPNNFPKNLSLKVVEHKRMKHLRMAFDLAGNLVLKKPKNVRKRDCEAFIAINMDWILWHVATRNQSIRTDAFYCFGQWLDFLEAQELILEALGNVTTKEFLYVLWQGAIFSQSQSYKTQLAMLYQKLLAQYVESRLWEFAKRMQLFPDSITYGKSYRQLGCCYGKLKKIRLSLRLVLLPKFCIDSVIIHELAHLKYQNHSVEFWNLVKSYDKNFKALEKWLLENGRENEQIYYRVFKC